MISNEAFNKNGNPVTELRIPLNGRTYRWMERAVNFDGSMHAFHLKWFCFEEYYDIDPHSTFYIQSPALYYGIVIFNAKATVKPIFTERMEYWIEQIRMELPEVKQMDTHITIKGVNDARVRHHSNFADYMILDDIDTDLRQSYPISIKERDEAPAIHLVTNSINRVSMYPLKSTWDKFNELFGGSIDGK